MCRQDAHLGLSDEEEVAAEQSFSVYCRPVEFYNILKCRAEMNPPYLQRSLSYKIQAKHKTRINLTVKVPEILSTDGEVLNLFPLHVMLGRRKFDGALVNDSHDDNFCDYNFSRLCVLRNSKAQGNFVLPDVTKLAEEAKSGSLYIVFLCQVEDNRPSNGNLSSDYHFVSDGHGLCGKLSLDLLFLTWGRSDSWASHQAAELTLVADLHPSFLKWDCTNEREKLSVQKLNESAKLQVQANLSALAVGSRERSSYDAYSLNNVPLRSLARIMLDGGFSLSILLGEMC